MKQITQSDLAKYEKKYDRKLAYRMLKKLRKVTRKKPALLSKPVGVVVECLGHFLSALDNPSLPVKEKIKIVCAVAYIISPIDLVPDAIPILGFSDDAAAAKLVINTAFQYSTFSLQELDDEIDGIVPSNENKIIPLENKISNEVFSEEVENNIAEIEKQAAEYETSETYSSTNMSFDELHKKLDEGNQLFQKFLDKNYELDNEFNSNQKNSDSLSKEMWSAIEML